MKPQLQFLTVFRGALLTILFLLAPLRPSHAAVMEDYCSVPPSVSQTIIPNIMIAMDNSKDLGPAHVTPDPSDPTKDVYDPAQAEKYIGYFKPSACYAYGKDTSGGNLFKEELNSAASPDQSYTFNEPCPTTAPFRGSLMNWATMSKRDTMLWVLIGGNSASKQGNAHTLVSTSEDWTQSPTLPKSYAGCLFKVNNAKLDIEDESADSCTLLDATPTAIADARPLLGWGRVFAWLSQQVEQAMTAWLPERIKEPLAAAMAWLRDMDWIAPAWAGHPLAVVVTGGTLTDTDTYTVTGTVGTSLTISMTCGGSSGAGGCPNGTYTWTIAPPSWLTLSFSDSTNGKQKGVNATLSETPTVAGTDTFTATLSLSKHTSKTITIIVDISDPAPPPPPPPPPPGPGGPRGASFTVKVELIEELFIDRNDNDIWDMGEVFNLSDDRNGNGVWDGKQGVVQKFIDAVNPKARWGMLSFDKDGEALISPSGCIPAGIPEPSSFYADIQNSSQSPTRAPLAWGIFSVINYYSQGYYSPLPTEYPGYTGCNNKDPMDAVPCRKNFLLGITSGEIGDPGIPTHFFDISNTPNCSTKDNYLIQNACFGKNTDLRSDLDKTQNVTTFIVKTPGKSTPGIEATLEAAALAGGSKKVYRAETVSELYAAFESALSDILSQATSGTAVSVLTTSSRNLGSLLQAYFLPARQDGTRSVTWTGFMQNLWMDQNDTMREDTVSDRNLALSQDNVVKLFFDVQANEAKVGLFTTDSDGTGGSLSTCTPVATQPFTALKPIFEAGQKLAQRLPSTRQIFTASRVYHGTTETTTGCAGLNCFTTTGITPVLTTALAAETAPSSYTAENIVRYVRGECLEGGAADDTPCGATVNPLFRDRRITVDGDLRVWKLGDIVNATPKTLANTPLNSYHVDYGDLSYYQYVTNSAYKERAAVSFVGANDGMVHAFRIGYLEDRNLSDPSVKAAYSDSYGTTASLNVGEEMWAYIPYNAFPYLKYLADPEYCHIYFNDLSVKLFDASTGGASGDPRPPDGTSWKSILVGGMRFGGACDGGLAPAPPLAGVNVGFSAYYAIDVTDPENPIPLWEFSAPDLGYATTAPGIVRTGDREQNGNWYVVVGSGSTQLPGGLTDAGRDRTGQLFFIDLRDGHLQRTVSLTGDAIVGDILSVDADKEYRSEKIYFGTSHQVATTATNPLGWAGTLSTVAIPETTPVESSTTLTLTTLFEGNYPIVASPDAAVDGQKVWVFAGSGKYHSDLDEADTQEQIFLGMVDPNTPLPTALTTADLTDRTNVSTAGTIAATTEVCLYDAATNTFDFKDVVTEITPTGAAISPAEVGWYIRLTGGERVITKPVAVGGLVDFLSYVPNPDVCEYAGSTSLYAVGYTTGVAPATVALLTPDVVTDASGNVVTDPVPGGSVVLQPDSFLGKGAPPPGEGIIISQPGEGEDTLTKHIQLGTVAIANPKNQPPIPVSSQIQHWLKK